MVLGYATIFLRVRAGWRGGGVLGLGALLHIPMISKTERCCSLLASMGVAAAEGTIYEARRTLVFGDLVAFFSQQPVVVTSQLELSCLGASLWGMGGIHATHRFHLRC